MHYRRSQLSDPIRRLIKRKETYLSRRCGLIWEATNPRGETFLFGRFNRGRSDHIVVTLGYKPHKEGSVYSFLPSH